MFGTGAAKFDIGPNIVSLRSKSPYDFKNDYLRFIANSKRLCVRGRRINEISQKEDNRTRTELRKTSRGY